MANVLLVSALGVLALLTVARGGFDSSSKDMIEVEAVTEDFSTWCISSRREQARWEVNRIIGLCFTTSIEVDTFMSDFYALSNETRTTFFPRYCPQMKNATSCVNRLPERVKPCLEESEFTFFKAAFDTFPHLVDLICKDDGEILLRLVERNYDKCVMRDIHRLCIEPFQKVYNDWDMSHLTTSQCGAINDMKHCAVRKLNMCQAPELVSLYDRFHNELIRDTPCREIMTNVSDTNQTKIENNAANEE